VCPAGQTCFGNVADCDGKLPPLTAEDVGLAEKTYTQEEIDVLIAEEEKKYNDEIAMADPMNWWCGSSWTDMLENCSKRCTTDEDCAVNSWTPGTCYKTTGGEENCQTPGVGVKEKLPEGSRWCGSTWNDMLETCSQKCAADEDCDGGKTCWEAPGTCQYVGVPVKEVSDPATLWCGYDFTDAQTSCHKACPSESDDDCPEGMSCFGGSDCAEEGVAVVREGYRCGSSWEDSSTKCGVECQTDGDCTVENGADAGDICWADVICASEMASDGAGGMYCGVAWDDTSCDTPCEKDDDCGGGSWCYWVDCGGGEEEEVVATTEATSVGCSAEVFLCPNGEWVGRNADRNCEFYPCPESDGDEELEAEALEETEADSSSESNNDMEQNSSEGESTNADAGGEESAPVSSEGGGGAEEGGGGGGDESSGGGGEESAGGGGGGGDEPAAAGGEDEPSSGGDNEPSAIVIADSSPAESSSMLEWGSFPLKYVGCEAGAQSCGMCEGDCNDDSDCQPGLVCFSRSQGEMSAVPGCLSGGGEDIAGMDYCHDPNPPTTTTTSTTTTTVMTTTTTPEPIILGDLVYSRECSESNQCGVCEGDCDGDEDCQDGLKCFSRGEGIMERVPGCNLLGIAGMDYCYDPNASLAQMFAGGTTTTGTAVTTTQAASGGCSAEVHVCPGGGMVFRDPTNSCEFEPCPNSQTKSTTSNQPASTTTANDATLSYYCGYNMNQVNNNCHKAIACPSGLNTDCPGLEVCIKDTNCDSSSTTTIVTTTADATSTSSGNETTPVTTTVVTTNVTTTTETIDACDTLCLDVLPPEFCPDVLDLPSCLEIEVGQVCESDGECATTDQLNNCGTYDIYVRVQCGGSTPSQSELMNALQATTTEMTTVPATTTAAATTLSTEVAASTTSISSSTQAPSNSTTPSPEANTTVAPVGTTTAVSGANDTVILDTGNMTAEASQMFAPLSGDPTLSSVESLLEAASNQEASTPPTEPPVESLISNAAANFNYDRAPVKEEPVLDEQSPTSSLHETSNNDPYYSGSDSVSSSGSNQESSKDPWSNSVGWDFDTYFTSTLQNPATIRVLNVSLSALAVAIAVGML